MLEKTLLESISTLSNYIKKRIELYGEEFLHLSQEYLITFLYVYSLVQNDNKIIDRTFIDYPFMKKSGSRGKFDIYIDIEPGYYIEVKYIRPIPSGMNLPLPQHRGSLINDMIRLAFKTPAKSNKYLLLVASQEFIVHILNKPGFPLNEKLWHGKIGDLIVVDTEKDKISNENKKYLDKEVKQQLLIYRTTYPLYIAMWKIS